MDYGGVAEHVFGFKARVLVDFMVAATQFSFAMCLITYITTAGKSVVYQLGGGDHSVWTIAWFMMCIVLPLALIRNVARLAFTYTLGVTCIFSTVCVVTIILTLHFFSDREKWGKNLEAINPNTYMSFVGFSVYSYEGIGCVLPIMQKCALPEQFHRILLSVIIFLTVIYVGFGEACLFYLGSDLKYNFITQELNQKSWPVITIQCAMIVNLLVSYSIMIHPFNQILEKAVFSPIKDKEANKSFMYHCQTVMRIIILLIASYCAITLQKQLAVFVAILGALLCAPLAITMPIALHLKHKAVSTNDKVLDWFLIIVSILALILSTY